MKVFASNLMAKFKSRRLGIDLARRESYLTYDT